MTSSLTKEYLDRALTKVASKGDVAIIKQDLKEVKTDASETKAMVNTHYSGVDAYLKRTETWHDEFDVLQARFKQVVHLLYQKASLRKKTPI